MRIAIAIRTKRHLSSSRWSKKVMFLSSDIRANLINMSFKGRLNQPLISRHP